MVGMDAWMSGKPPRSGEASSSASANPPSATEAGAPASGRQDAAAQQLPGSLVPPSVSLPTGGGAIRGIGEKFSVTAATGTASLAVPVAASPGRSGFGPALSLYYDSGAGNGPFGLGWKLSPPAITRKTDKGLPHYADDPDLDTFLLTGADDLVPVRTERDGGWEQVPHRRRLRGREYAVQRYRPRVEGLFSRIERWRDLGSGETHWRTITSANVTTRYGTTPDSRIADPADPARVFSWLICESYDDIGNAARYEYVAEDSADVDTARPSERNRTARSRSANRYIKRIRYGNRVPWRAGEERGPEPDWMFEVVFDYGEHHATSPHPAPDRAWPCRPDPFSTYRAGFEVRTYRRCHRVLMFHDFPEEPGVGADCLVSSTDLSYTSTGSGGMTTLGSVMHTGYRRLPGGVYRSQSLPPLEFRYSRPVIGRDVCDPDPRALENLPVGIEGTGYQWVDLDGEGLSGILARQGGAWFYKANLGDGHFAPERVLATQPAMAGTSQREQLLDLDGDGHLDLAELGGPMPGFYERTSRRGWDSFRTFRSWPNITWTDPNLRMVDLDGDGLADVLITSDDAFTWYPSLRYEGFGPGRRTSQPWDEERGPRVVFADPEQTIYLADMTGDGLTDLVRLRNGEICYWPNTGFGTFGTKVTMDRSPRLDEPRLFDQRRVRLADVDGSGTSDLVYLHAEDARVYFNQSGNGFSEAHSLGRGFPALHSLATVMVADLLGKGTACLVWSSPLPGDAGRQLRYLDLMVTGKPYLLTEVVNNLGAETRIGYAPSTRFYLADQAAGRPWITRLPFVVQVVERVETIDRINRNRFTTRYNYHHGYFDGFEREFRGFGMVETTDTEELAVLEAAVGRGEFANQDPATDVPPVLTRTWLHTGAFPGTGKISRIFEHEYCGMTDAADIDLPDTALPHTLRLTGHSPRAWQLSRVEAREACRALKGTPLREEVYALDGTQAAKLPYSVTEHNYTIELLQPALTPLPDGPANYHAVFLTHARESLTALHERTLYAVAGELRPDPRITHDVVLAADDYGNPLRTASVGYGRRFPHPELDAEDQQAQARLRLVYTENGYTNAVELPDDHRTPMPSETRMFEIIGLRPSAARRLFRFGDLSDRLAVIGTELPYQDWDTSPGDLPAPAKRLIEHTRARYRRDDLAGPLPLGELQPLGLPYRSYRLAYAAGLVANLYGEHAGRRMLSAAGYIRDGASWWIPSAQAFYSPGDEDAAAELAYAREHFFTAHRFRDPFGAVTTITYDRYDLLVTQSRDPLGNLVTAGQRGPGGEATFDGNDYRVLQPFLLSDPNRNRASVAFDALGRVAGTAAMGKPEQDLGDTLAGFDPDPAPGEVAAYFADPYPAAHRLLGQATTRVLYDPHAYQRTRGTSRPRPAWAAALARETHVSDLPPDGRTRLQQRFSFSDGFGREIQHKSQAAAGPVEDGPPIAHRWIGSGWTVFNNKGKPVRSFEPFFTATHDFEFARISGISAVLFYDPAGRVVATLRPDHAYEKTVFDPWRRTTWDANDTVLLDPRDDPDVAGFMGRYLAGLSQQPGGWATWYAARADGQLGRRQQRSAALAAHHAATPAQAWFDPLGRAFLEVEHNRQARDGQPADEFYRTHHVLDVQGNLRAVRDALGRVAMRYGYTVVGGQVTWTGMDAGDGGKLPDVLGGSVLSWNSRGFTFRTDYDALRLPVRGYVRGPGVDGNVLHRRTQYGEQLSELSPAEVEAHNLRARVAVQYDDAGIGTNVAYDFKGNLLEVRRQLAAGSPIAADWASHVPLEDPAYHSHTSYDALNRPVVMTSPDHSVMHLHYNAASLLDRLDARIRGAAEPTPLVTQIDYNARGQRLAISYGNDTHSIYTYDPLTFRLIRLTTWRGRRRLQDLDYTYDPVGNPTAIRDHAQQRVFFRNQVADPSASYVHDAIYRLVEASGREHLGQAAAPPTASDAPRLGLPQPGDGTAMARYHERYRYDAAGNLLRVAHCSADPGQGAWTREYRYREPSLLDPDRHSNRLTWAGPDGDARERRSFRYDQQGNVTAMSDIPALAWDPEDRLHATSRQAPASGRMRDPTYYAYDSGGQRMRKVTESGDGAHPHARRSERIYLGALEIYREYGADGAVTLERQTLNVRDDERRIALVETRTSGTDAGPERLIRYQLASHLESCVVELDELARVISYEEYYPYGSTSYQAVRAGTQTPKRYRYTGKERETETGLYYYGARYYMPWLGRWASCDPGGMRDGPNPYWYVRGRPSRPTIPTVSG